MNPDRVSVGLLGCGTVGSALVRLVADEGPAIRARTGLDLVVTRIAVRDVTRDRGLELDPAVLTADVGSVVNDPDVDVVVELMGGIEPARGLILEALAAGKPVVTGNKDLVASAGAELLEAADGAGVDLGFEAAVAGGIPLIRVLRESLVGERIRRMMGIVNGTTNYILTKMTEEGADYADVLAEAQELGYAEADPSADVDGLDAGAKAAIMAMVAFGCELRSDDVYVEGISALGADDIDSADRLGHVIKLLAIVEEMNGAVSARVHPTMVPRTHPLAAVRDSFNAVFVEGDAVGELMLYGPGAGGAPTASAVMGDLIEAALDLRRSTTTGLGTLLRPVVLDMGDTRSAFHLQLDVADRPGVLAQVAAVFGQHGVSIRSMEQMGMDGEARLIFITHTAREADVRSTLAELAELDCVDRVGSVIRVISDEAD